MKRMLFCTIFSIFLWTIGSTFSWAESDLILRTNTNQIEIGNTFELSVFLPGIDVAACTLQIFFNPSQVEVTVLPSSNYQLYGNRILYTWHDATGGNAPIIDSALTTISFKAIQTGSIDFSVHAQVVSVDQEEIHVSKTYSLEAISVTRQIEDIPSSNTSSSDTSLFTLRISEEGLTPAFDSMITEYYYLAPMSIENLKVTALPQNANATVEVTGNTHIPIRRKSYSDSCNF